MRRRRNDQESEAGQSSRRPGKVVGSREGQSVGGDERFGFLNGYFDRYPYEFKGPDRYPSLAVMYRTAITEFYKRGPSPELEVAVSESLHRLRDPEAQPAIDQFGGRSSEPHGRNDGLYWREISARGGPGDRGKRVAEPRRRMASPCWRSLFPRSAPLASVGSGGAALRR